MAMISVQCVELTCMLKMQAILIAQRIPSRHRDATSWSSQSCRPTLNAANRGVHANCHIQTDSVKPKTDRAVSQVSHPRCIMAV